MQPLLNFRIVSIAAFATLFLPHRLDAAAAKYRRAGAQAALDPRAVSSGDGWTITLSPGWMVQPGQRNGDFEIAPAI